MKKCPKCGHLDLDDANFCILDGAELKFLQENTPELLDEMKKQSDEEWENWIEELIKLSEEEFFAHMEALFVGADKKDHNKLEDFLCTLLNWRKNGFPFIDREPKDIPIC